MTLMAVRPDQGVLGAIYDLAETDEASAQLVLQMGIYDALCDVVDEALPELQRSLAGHFAREADGMLEQTAKRYTLAKSLGQSTADLESVAEHLATARDAWITVSKLSPEQFDAYEAQGRIHRDGTSGRFTSGGIRSRVLNALGLVTNQTDDDMQQRTRQALESLTSGDGQSYNRMRALGQGLIATGQPHARAAGTAARLVADLGPEAQRVLEPGVRRAAYRYRGTEKRPSKQAQLDAIAVAASADGSLAGAPPAIQRRVVELSRETGEASGAGSRQLMAAPGRRAASPRPLSPAAAAILANPKRAGESTDQVALTRTSDFGALTLRSQVPDIDTASLSLEAGKMPPSIGMMFDADGHLVSEAQGFNGDHYLPFDLKNLKRLKGGSYVRTRTTGGLTDEDIYTGLMTGARQVTVVSNSGVFTLEFDPDLRGGRRYSDKARQMVQRYAALTATVGSGSVLQNDISRADKQRLRTEALEESGGDPTLTETLLRNKLEQARFESSFMGPDEDDLWKQAQSETARQYAQASRPQQLAYTNERFKALKAEAAQNHAKQFKLDHDGYAAAQKALATEFPYFIRQQKTTPLNQYLVDHGVLAPDEQLGRRGGKDIGYTNRRELAPASRSERERTGLRPRKPLGAGEGSAVDVPPATGSAAPAAGTQADSTATADGSYEAAQKAAAQRSTTALARHLSVFNAVSELGIKAQLLPGPDGKIAEPDNPEMPDLNGLEYARWVSNYFDGDMRAYAEFLQKPENHKHVAYAEKALDALEEELPPWQDPTYTGEAAAQARDTLALASGSGFAKAPENWVTYTPPAKNPQPVLVPELAQAGATPEGVKSFAAQHHEIAEQAAEWSEVPDSQIADLVREQAEHVSALMEWGGEGEPPPELDRSEARVARLMRENPELAKPYRQLMNSQAAWSLKRANLIVAAAHNVQPLDLADLGKARAPAPPGATKVTTEKRLVVHGPQSAAAVGLAKALQRQGKRPASR